MLVEAWHGEDEVAEPWNNTSPDLRSEDAANMEANEGLEAKQWS